MNKYTREFTDSLHDIFENCGIEILSEEPDLTKQEYAEKLKTEVECFIKHEVAEINNNASLDPFQRLAIEDSYKKVKISEVVEYFMYVYDTPE